jgi:DNA-binding TFAR19-related protein (PDSD5 family)
MSMRVRRIAGVVFSALITAALAVVSVPCVSYAQPGGLADRAKAKAAEDLTRAAMKEIEKKIADVVGKKTVSEAGKANAVKKFSDMAKQIVKKSVGGKLPDRSELVNAVMKEILPQIEEHLAEIAKTENERITAPEPELVSLLESMPITVPSAPPLAMEPSGDWVVNSAKAWIETLNGIRNGGDGKTHTVIVSGDISVPFDDGGTFGSVKNITVIMDGGGTLSLSGDGSLLRVGAGQTVSVRGALNLRGRGENIVSAVVVDSGGTFIMGGSAAVIGNTASGDGGGVFVRGGVFRMEESSSVSGNSAKGNGGGVFVRAGEFEMRGSARLSDNSANNGGGGVYVESGKFVMADFAMDLRDTAWLGGGVYIGSAGTFIMLGSAMVSRNTAHQQGGGVYFAGKEFFVKENAVVSSNSAVRLGSDVYFAGLTFAGRDGAKVSDSTADISDGVYFAGKVRAPSNDGKER